MRANGYSGSNNCCERVMLHVKWCLRAQKTLLLLNKKLYNLAGVTTIIDVINESSIRTVGFSVKITLTKFDFALPENVQKLNCDIIENF